MKVKELKKALESFADDVEVIFVNYAPVVEVLEVSDNDNQGKTYCVITDI